MAEFPALPLFTDAYLADTRHLTAAQHGAYLLLLMTAWRSPDCALPDDDEAMARWAAMDRRTWERHKAVVMAFWKLGEDQRWRQARLSDERDYVSHVRLKKVKAGEASVLKRKNRNLTSVLTEGQHNGSTHTLPIPIPQEEPPTPPNAPGTGADTFALNPPRTSTRRKTRRSTDQIRKALAEDRGKWWDAFWDVFPCHDGLNAGMDAYERLVRTRDQALEIYHGAKRYAAKCVADPTIHVKFSQGWLNGERWKDANIVPATPERRLTPTEQAIALAHERIAREKENHETEDGRAPRDS